jgi:hypothetical protein
MQLNYDHSLGWSFLFSHSSTSGGLEREGWHLARVSHLERKQQPLVSCAQATRMEQGPRRLPYPFVI